MNCKPTRAYEGIWQNGEVGEAVLISRHTLKNKTGKIGYPIRRLIVKYKH
tara:strand:+ start:150 stop:299 length:150 start_codon:yes stop_codon:yes gene_type:complete